MGGKGGSGIPSEYTMHIGSDGTTFTSDIDLDNIHVKELPDINFRAKELPTINMGDINSRVKELPDINMRVKELPTITLDTNVAVKELPQINSKMDLNIALKEIPDTRVHLPADFCLGLSVLGVQLVSLSLCGEAQVIIEKNVPHRLELCK